MQFREELTTKRTKILSEAEALQQNGFKNDEQRAAFDGKMAEVAALDTRLKGLDALDRGAALDAAPWNQNHTHISGDERMGGYTDNVRLMAEALSARIGGPAPSEPAREFVRMGVPDMAARCLEARGISTRTMGKQQIVQRALHTTSDFPELLTATGNRTLRQGYESYPGGLRRICKESTAPDFRAKSKLQLGEAPELRRVLEHGEVTRGTMAESKQSYSLETFARIFGITRQALVNDDLGAFGSMALRLGRASAEFIASALASKLTSNPTMDYDTTPLFHADHGNLAGSAAAISIASLGAALKSMRLQTGLDGVTVIDVTPKYLIVPAALEVIARQYVAQIQPAQSSNVNPFTSNLDVVVDPRLDASSITAWYLAADSDVIDTIEYSFLESEPGPQIETRAGFDVEGIEMKVRLDFGCGVIDHRGLFKNVGA